MRHVFLITIETGKWCGVAEYTRRLAAELTRMGSDCRIEALADWSYAAVRQSTARIAGDKDVTVHIQYPTLGMGRSPMPGFLPLLLGRDRLFLTLHEFDNFNPIRKAFFAPWRDRMSHVVFTNELERHSFARFFRVSEADAPVVPIGNNIAVAAEPAVRAQQLVYFGQIISGKGIEEFIDTVRRLRKVGSELECAIIGGAVQPGSGFLRGVESAARDCCISLLKDMPAQQVSQALKRASIALLPFPDGATDKRSSLLACLQHGLAVITAHSPATPEWLKRTTYPFGNPDECLSTILKLAGGELPPSREPDLILQELARRDWSAVAEAHLRLYGR